MDERPRIVWTISDLHAGSTRAVCPPGLALVEGGTYGLNRGQQWLWDRWEAMLAEARGYIRDSPFVLVLNGDMIEGMHHRTTEVVSPDVADHVAAAIELVRPVSDMPNCARVYVVRGTETHTGPSAEHAIGIAVGAERSPDTGAYARDRLLLRIADTPCSFSHHTSTSSVPRLMGGAVTRQHVDERQSCIDHGHEPPMVVGRAHRHTMGVWTDGSSMSFTTPSWQMLTRFGHRAVAGARVHVGSVILDWRGREDHSVPHAELFRYDTLPDTEDVV